MKATPLRTLAIGILGAVAYAFLCMLIMQRAHNVVSVAYIFVVPLILGAIPVLFSTREGLRTYIHVLLIPVITVLSFFALSFVAGFEGMICLVVIIGPFVLLGALGAFIVRLIRLKTQGPKTPLYTFVLLPFLLMIIEERLPATNSFHTVTTSLDVSAARPVVWANIKNVTSIGANEINPHFVHAIGIPKPISGILDREGVGGTRHIIWEGGIRFREVITHWSHGHGFAYDIEVDPSSIPPHTLDEHVMIGGKYFDVVSGSYRIDSLTPKQSRVVLSCTYRITTNLNGYSRWWADFMLSDFNETILEVIRGRSE